MDSFTGIVSSVKVAGTSTNNVYTILSENVVCAKSEIELELFDTVRVTGDVGDTLKAGSVEITGKAARTEYKKALKKIIDRIMKDKNRKAAKSGIKELDKVTSEMNGRLSKAKKRFLENFISGSPIVGRFHNDCDGSSGAVAMNRALEKLHDEFGAGTSNVSWRMNKSVAYTKESFYADTFFFNTFKSVEKPLVFITDFGTMPETEESLKLADKIDFVWMEHHPIFEGFMGNRLKHYINPWNFGGDSEYTAGFLTSTFAEMLTGGDYSLMKNASLIGDFSVYADRTLKDANKVATVLDYLTSKKGEDTITPKQIDAVLSDKKELDDTFTHASTLLNEVLDIGVTHVQKYRTIDGMNVFVLDFKHIPPSDNLLPGRYSSKLQERLELVNGKETITIVHYGNFVSVRLNKSISGKVELHKKMGNIKESTTFVQSFGGHDVASSMKTDKEHVAELVDLLLDELKVKR